MMEIKKDLNIAAEIARITKQNENAKPVQRFYLPLNDNDVYALIGRYYNAEVLKRCSSDKYVELDDAFKDKLHKVATWLCNAEKRPGLMFLGEVGTGKTTLLRTMVNMLNRICEREKDANNKYVNTLDGYNPISIIKAKEIINDYIMPDLRYRYDMMLSTSILAIDELGVENLESKVYGNVSEPLIDLLCERYDRQLTTIISTNLGNKEIGERYGKRIGDRFNEMFSTIPFTGKSYRK